MKMRKKTSNRNSMMENAALFFVIVLISASVESLSTQTTPATPAVVTTPNLETCQCGVFLLGTQPLVFSADAKPILSGESNNFAKLLNNKSEIEIKRNLFGTLIFHPSPKIEKKKFLEFRPPYLNELTIYSNQLVGRQLREIFHKMNLLCSVWIKALIVTSLFFICDGVCLFIVTLLTCILLLGCC